MTPPPPAPTGAGDAQTLLPPAEPNRNPTPPAPDSGGAAPAGAGAGTARPVPAPGHGPGTPGPPQGRGTGEPATAAAGGAPERGPGGPPPVSGRGGVGEVLAPAGSPGAVGTDRAGAGSPVRALADRARPGAIGAALAGEAEAGRAGSAEVAEPGRRIEGLLLGLAAGDAAGWPAARHRASRMPQWTRRLTRELDTFAEQNATTTLPVPIALNQPPEPLRLGPSDDAEWAAFAAESVLTAAGALLSDLSRSRRMRAAIDLAWNALASEVAAAAERAPEVESAVLPMRARISVRAGLGNLAAGLRPPATGHDNPHYFDDAACVRACVLAVVHPGDPRAAAELAEFDARYTQDGDGVHGARAMAAAVAAALAGAGTDAAVEAALEQLPAATEIGRNARHAVALARAGAEGAFALVPLLEHQIVDHVYSYGIAAAETVPVALALATAARGRAAEAVPAAACLSRVADSAPALAGALTGALGGGGSLPASWREACRVLSGCALPRLAGTDLVELAALLTRTELTSPKG
ncbi:ADP-ribosylglycohydrolase family protein [Streptomyces sp. NPDC059708]|uniref:ADP-ribosylglycohydrolase family protein n=1 Tax=Streptomyces sp. NPDC059708 TaxID=3346916 RepID=UPI0036A9FC3A